jgi:putative phosphoesterase
LKLDWRTTVFEPITLEIGVIADTHGLLRPQALEALRGVSVIVHAGDIGRPEVVAGLEAVAPVLAIRGNVDRGAWSDAFPATRVVEVGGACLYVLHDVETLDLDPAAAGMAAVISGHSHQPRVELQGGVLYLNPGSAGPRRFRLPVSLARLRVTGNGVDAALIELSVG